MTSRPCRAVAYYLVGGGVRHVVGRASAATPQGLSAFVDRHTAAGAQVDTWEVQELPGLTDADVQAARTPSAGLRSTP